MDIDGKIDESKIREILNNKECVCFDEINQAPICIHRVLCALSKSFKIFGFGDFRQEEPAKEKSDLWNYYKNYTSTQLQDM